MVEDTLAPQTTMAGDGPRQVGPEVDLVEWYYEQGWGDMLGKTFGEDEAERFERMTPFRAFVRNHYRIVNKVGEHVLFELDPSKANQASKESL